MTSYIPFDTLQEADTRSAEYWTAHLGRQKRAEDVTEYLYGRVADEDGGNPRIVVPDRDRYLDGLIRADELAADELAALVNLYPAWSGDGVDYQEHDIRAHGGTLYKCVQPHTSQPDWTPDATPALWVRATPEGIVPEWTQPTGSTDAYPLGARVTRDGKVWESEIDNNVWEPSVHGWIEVSA